MRLEDWIRSQVLLEPGERILGIYKTKQNPFAWSGLTEGHIGYLVLTTNRLLFYKKIRRTYELQVDLHLEDIREMNVGGNFIRHIIINGMKFFPKNGKPKTLERLIHSTIQTARMRRIEIDSQQSQIQTNISVPLVQKVNPPKVCMNCGFQNEVNGIFCKKCGTEL